jgi:hypothetical protein
MPVIDHFRSQGKVHHIIADRGVEEVFESTKAAVTPIVEKEVRLAGRARNQIDRLGEATVRVRSSSRAGGWAV